MPMDKMHTARNFGIFMLVTAGVVGLVAFIVWGVPAIRREMAKKKAASSGSKPKTKAHHGDGGGGFHPTTGPNPPALKPGYGHPGFELPPLPPAVSGAATPSPYALDQLGAGQRRSNRATGYSADTTQTCYSENLIGAQQFGVSQKGGNTACSFPSTPIGSESVPLGTASMALRGSTQTTPIDLSNYARMGSDRSLSAVGLDAPEDLALASAQLGHVEVAGNTRMDTWDPRGETPSSWTPSYTLDSSGRLQPGAGAYIPDGACGPYQLAQRPVGPVF